MIRGQNLPAITQIADSDVLIVDSASGGTRKITYAQLCQAVKQTLGIREVIDSVNITEDGYLMGGKVIADALAQLNSNMLSAKLKYTDIQLTATQNGSVTQIIDTHEGYVIPVLINSGSNSWDVYIGMQVATGTLVLSGPGVASSYTYTVRIYYI